MSTPTSTPQEKDTDDNNNNNNMMDGLAPRDEEAGFKESTVPPWRFWAVSVGYVRQPLLTIGAVL